MNIVIDTAKSDNILCGGPLKFVEKFYNEGKRIKYPIFYADEKIDNNNKLSLLSITQSKKERIEWIKQRNGKLINRMDGVWYWSEMDCNAANQPMIDTMKVSDGIIYQSFFSMHCCDKFFGKMDAKSTVIYNGSDTGIYKENTNIEKENSICCCTYQWRNSKGLGNILLSLNNLLEKSAIKLYIIGSGAEGYVNALSEKAKKNIITTGLIDHNKISEIYNKCKALIHLAYLDPCPNSVVDAINCGLPVICLSTGGTSEIASFNRNSVIIDAKPFDFKNISYADIPPINKIKIEEAVIKIIDSNDKLNKHTPLPISICFTNYINFINGVWK